MTGPSHCAGGLMAAGSDPCAKFQEFEHVKGPKSAQIFDRTFLKKLSQGKQ